MAVSSVRPRNGVKLSRQANAVQRYDVLLESAIRSVGEFGFNQASVARITEAAGVSPGTLYSYFPSHAALLRRLLPVEGRRLLDTLERETVAGGTYFDGEGRRLEALMRYLDDRPYILRLLKEAEVAAPDEYRGYMDSIAARYIAVFDRAQSCGEVRRLQPREIWLICETLAGCCSHIATRLLAGRRVDPEGAAREQARAVRTYVTFITHGLGSGGGNRAATKRSPAPPVIEPNDVRTRLLEAAIPEFAKAGIAATQIRSIAARAGLSVGTFYNNFDGREAFVAEFLLYIRKDLVRWVTASTTGVATFAEREAASIDALIDYSRYRPRLFGLLVEAAILQPQDYDHHFAVISRQYRREMARARRAGELAHFAAEDLEMLGIMLTGARRLIASRFLDPASGRLPVQLGLIYADFVCRGLIAGGRDAINSEAPHKSNEQ